MESFKDKFKTYNGELIPDIINYILSYIEKDPTATITVGCDSIQKRRKTVYAITIVFYDNTLKKGANVVFFKDIYNKIKNNNERLYKEAQYLFDVASYLNTELSNKYIRKDLDDFELKRYKYHLLRCNKQYGHIPNHLEESFIRNLTLLDEDKINFKLVDIHIDFNPNETRNTKKGIYNNKSNYAYKAYVPWLRGLGFRTWAKPLSYASSSAADFLIR